MKNVATWFSLFASASTLLCCALPALMVLLGMGAAMAGLVSSFPQLMWVSQYKEWFFGGSAGSLLIAGYLQYRARKAACPLDEAKAAACSGSRKWSLRIFIASVVVWCIGSFFAFVAPLL